MRKLLREAKVILPIGLIGSMLLILCTYIFKGIFYIIEKLSGFFEEDGFILVALGIFTIAFAIKWVYTADQKDDGIEAKQVIRGSVGEQSAEHTEHTACKRRFEARNRNRKREQQQRFDPADHKNAGGRLQDV